MITTGIIKNLKPCPDRLENYLNHYENKTFTYAQFISLDEISFEDKMWVLLRLMSLENVVSFSQDADQCADQCADQDAKDAYQDVARYAQYVARCAVQDVARCADQDADQEAARYAQDAGRYAQDAVQCAAQDFVLNLTLKYLKKE